MTALFNRVGAKLRNFKFDNLFEASLKTNHYLDLDASSRLVFTSGRIAKVHFRNTCSVQNFIFNIEKELKIKWKLGENSRTGGEVFNFG